MASLVSAEFVALCQGQLRLLVQSTGASLGAVYVAEDWLGGEGSGWLPVAIYPENAAALGGMGLLNPVLNDSGEEKSGTGELPVSRDEAFAAQGREGRFPPEAQPPADQEEKSSLGAFLSARLRRWQRAMEKGPEEVLAVAEPGLEPDGMLGSGESQAGLLHQAMQPLLFDGRAVGMVVAAREQLDWQLDDYSELERIAQTLSTACAMERRLQWLQTRVHQQEIAQEKQQDIIDNLLHQFRNPLTALRTFGKLLVRRLSPDDRNQAVAAGIVRESDRLQGLLMQIGETVDRFALPGAVMGEIVSESSQALPRLLPGSQLIPEHSQGDGDPGAPEAEKGLPLALPPVERPALPAAPSSATSEQLSPLTGKPLVLGQHLVAQLIGERLPSWEAIAQLQDQRVWASLESELPAVWADGEALIEVLSNLVDNGLKYGSPRGTVTIAVRSSANAPLADDSLADVSPSADAASDNRPGMAESKAHQPAPRFDSAGPWQCIAISDDGPGIPEGDLPRLFERHYRGVQAEGMKSGTGLGLAIARSLVEQMGGHIQVQSPAGPFHPKVAFELDEALDPALYPGSAFLIWLRGCLESQPSP